MLPWIRRTNWIWELRIIGEVRLKCGIGHFRKRGKAELEPEESGRLRTMAKKTARSHSVLQSTVISDKHSELSHLKDNMLISR